MKGNLADKGGSYLLEQSFDAVAQFDGCFRPAEVLGALVAHVGLNHAGWRK